MFRTANSAIFLICLLLLLLGCENQSKIVRLSGEISPNSILPIIKAINQGANTLIVNSGGGHEVSAIKLANVIYQNRVKIVVEHKCMSACAFYLFPSAVSRRIEPDALVSFHNNSYSALHLLKLEKLSNTLNPDIQQASRDAKELYDKLSISTEVFNDAQKVMQAICIDTTKKGSAERPELVVQFQIWIPNKSYMFQNGFSFEGYWPTTQEQIAPLLREIYKNAPRQRFTFYFGGDQSLIRNDKKSYEVGLCSDYNEGKYVE